ncbi:MAG: prolipoprotein diacylglyceryl transferase [Clostridiales bacterium]|nr:prolipoprotein diacylglyceryl transferase [Clostridiales bacterium]
MYPHPVFLGMNLYDLLTAFGLLAALIVFRYYLEAREMPRKYQLIFLGIAIPAVCIGYLAAALFQAFYDYLATGVFAFGAITFMGGLIGGAVFYLLCTWFIGKIAFTKEKQKEFFGMFLHIVDVAPCCIAIAHAFGRLGCLFGGCCYGKETHAWYGVSTPFETHKVVPLQLFEALFLFGLFAFLTYLFFKKKKLLPMPVYLIGYGIWRFVIEFFRSDERGATIISAFTPSQLTSLLSVLLGVVLLYRYFFIKKQKDFN